MSVFLGLEVVEGTLRFGQVFVRDARRYENKDTIVGHLIAGWPYFIQNNE